MAFAARAVKVPPNSANIQEAKERVFDFFKMACRSIPTIMDIYILDDVVTASQLRTTIASEIRKYSHVTDPKVYKKVRERESVSSRVIDMLLFKGHEELNNIVEHAKQRHHILGQYVLGKQGAEPDSPSKDEGTSNFLKNFYSGNYH